MHPTASNSSVKNPTLNSTGSGSAKRNHSDYIALVKGDIKRHGEDRYFNTATWMEKSLDIAVTHPQGADVRV